MACRFFINDGFTVVSPLDEIYVSSGAPVGSTGKPVGSPGAAADAAGGAADVDGSSRIVNGACFLSFGSLVSLRII